MTSDRSDASDNELCDSCFQDFSLYKTQLILLRNSSTVFLTCLDWRRERKIKEKREKKKDYQRLNIDDVSLQATAHGQRARKNNQRA